MGSKAFLALVRYSILYYIPCMPLISGVYTSSVYIDSMTHSREFLNKPIVDGSASPIKTHRTQDSPKQPQVDFDKVILILRDPYDSLRANYNRLNAGKTGVVDQKKFKMDGKTFEINATL